MRIFCPAKINLFLSVGPPDARGYHPIRTIFQAIGLFDELDITPKGPGCSHSFTCESPEVPDDNTVTKALRLLSELAQVPPLHIELFKRIPAQSGLGGGSSDAAGLIRVINRFLPAPIAEHHLMDVAVAVGADVPFFLVGGLALGEGYGEKLTPLPDQEVAHVVVVRPNVGVSTKNAYAQLDSRPRRWRPFPKEVIGLRHCHNDFSLVEPDDCHGWKDDLDALGAYQTELCGSGSAVFGLFDSAETAAKAHSLLASKWTRSYGQPRGEIPVWLTRTLSRVESLRVESL